MANLTALLELKFRFKELFKTVPNVMALMVSKQSNFLIINKVFVIDMENICKLLKYCEDKKDCWLIYEVC